jgi:arginyl-tRNA synthetase
MQEQKIHSSETDTHHTDIKNCSISPISDPSLAMLREQIKSIMIPLLIKVFHIKLEAQQSSSPPCRLTNKVSESKVEELKSQLENLDEDLRMISVWCQSCRNQIQKVLDEIKVDFKTSIIKSGFTTNPNVQKSFSDALASQKEELKKSAATMLPQESSDEQKTANESTRHPWWNRFFKH